MATGSREARRLAVAGGIVGTGALGLYLFVMVAEGNNPAGQIVLWTALMTVPTVLAFTSMTLRPVRARWALGAAAVLFVPLVPLTSLGFGFLIAAVAVGLAASKVDTAVS